MEETQKNLMAQVDEVITTIKRKYIGQRCAILPKNEVVDEILDTICKFDFEADATMATNLLKKEVEPITDLWSWLIFKGDALRTQWNEVCELATENISMFLLPNTTQELLDFLKKSLNGVEKCLK